MSEQRIRLLEDKFMVITREFNETLGEIQTSLAGITKGNSMAFQVLAERIRALESEIDSLRAKVPGQDSDKIVPIDSDRTGKEL